MVLYRVLLFVHVFGVIGWFGTGVVFLVLTERAARTKDPGAVRTLVGTGEALGPRYFGIVTVVVLASGVGLVLVGRWGLDHLFIIGGLLGFLATSVIGGAVIAPVAERIGAALTTTGPEAQVARDLRRLRNIGRLDASIMTVIVFLMTVKPGL